MSLYQYKSELKFKCELDELWDFIATPTNLKNITPAYMGFEILNDDLPEKMYPGMIISYRVKPMLNIPTNWVTEITHIRDKEYFVDEQRVGPYAMWHHQHILEPLEDGIVMRDIVSYKPPFGFIGSIANHLFIRFKIQEIFEFRTQAFEKQFEIIT